MPKYNQKASRPIDDSYKPSIHHPRYQHDTPLSLNTLRWAHIQTLFLITIIPNKNRYTLFENSPYARAEGFKVLSPKSIDSQRNKISCLMRSFNDNLKKPDTEVNLVLANRDLQWLVQHMVEFRRYCPFIELFLDSYEIFTAQMGQESKWIPILDKSSLINLKEAAAKLSENLRHIVRHIIEEHKYTSPDKELEPYYLHMDMIKYFEQWFGVDALARHEFETPILQAMEQQWLFLIKLIQDFHKGSFVSIPYYLSEVGTSYKRTFLTEYHRQLEDSLGRIRNEACQQQVKNTLFYEEWLKLKSIQKQNPMESISGEDRAETLNYKKALNQVTAICQYDPALKGKKLPSALTTILSLSKTKIPPISKEPSVALQHVEEKEEKVERYPLIRPYLLGLKSLKTLQTHTSAFLKTLKAASFWYGLKKQYRPLFIELLEEYEDCFRIQNLDEDTQLMRSNACLKKVILYLQHSEALYEFECETQRDIGQKLKDFFAAYTDVLQTELLDLKLMNINLLESTVNLESQIENLKIANADAKTEESMFLVDALVTKVTKGANNPYRQALINIIMVMLHATDLSDSPQLLTPLLAILKQSFQALMPLKKEAVGLPYEALPLERKVDYSQEEKIPTSLQFSFQSLEFLQHFTQTLTLAYTDYQPEKNWSLKFFGATDRMGGYEDRQSLYISFCNTIKEKLAVFNQAVNPEALSHANVLLQDLMHHIDSSKVSDISSTFYEIYAHEKKLATKDEEVLLLPWESLKELNKTCLKLVPDMESLEAVEYGHLTNKPLVLTALKLFNNQFLSQSLQENQDFDKTFKANKALSCLMRIIFKDNTIYKSNSKVRLPLLLVEYNRHLEELLRQIHIQVNRKKLCNRVLDQVLKDEATSKFSGINREARLYNQIKKELDKHSQALYVPAIESLVSQLSKLKSPLAFQALGILEQLQKPTKYIPYDSDDEIEPEGILSVMDNVDAPEHPIFLSAQFLGQFTSHIKRLFKDEALYRGEDFWGFKTGAKELASLCSNFLKALTLREQAQTFMKLIGYISYSRDLRDGLNEDKRWELQLFLSAYSQLLTEHAKEGQSILSELDSRAEVLTAGIDAYRSQNLAPFFKPLVNRVLKEESLRVEPAKALITLLLTSNEIHVGTFSLMQMALQSLIVMIAPSHESSVQPLSLRF